MDEFVNRVIWGDCVKVLRGMPAASVDFVLTDPPYAARYRDRSGRTLPNDDNTRWLAPAFREVYGVMKRHSFCVSFYGWHKAEAFLAAWRAAGLRPVGQLVFLKEYGSNARGFLRYRHEAAYVLAKGNPDPPAERLDDVIGFRYTGNRYHPTEKPVESLIPIVKAFSKRGDIVLDPFAGSGTTALAARKLGRRYIAIELDRRYAENARRRLRAADYYTP